MCSQKRSHSNVIIVGRQVVPALSLRIVYASHSGNDAYGPQLAHVFREQPALRQEQTPGSSVGSRYQLPYRGWATTLVAIAQLTHTDSHSTSAVIVVGVGTFLTSCKTQNGALCFLIVH